VELPEPELPEFQLPPGQVCVVPEPCEGAGLADFVGLGEGVPPWANAMGTSHTASARTRTATRATRYFLGIVTPLGRLNVTAFYPQIDGCHAPNTLRNVKAVLESQQDQRPFKVQSQTGVSAASTACQEARGCE
jgi:hypothetical protein